MSAFSQKRTSTENLAPAPVAVFLVHRERHPSSYIQGLICNDDVAAVIDVIDPKGVWRFTKGRGQGVNNAIFLDQAARVIVARECRPHPSGAFDISLHFPCILVIVPPAFGEGRRVDHIVLDVDLRTIVLWIRHRIFKQVFSLTCSLR